MYAILWTPQFTRAAINFVQSHRELRVKFAAILRDLEHDPFQPHLKSLQLGGKLQGVQVVSPIENYRLTLTLIISDKEITLLDVSSQDEM